MIEPHARILIARISALGDCILTLPLLHALRRNLPKAHLAWATGPGPASLLRGHPCLDELIVVPRGWMGKPRLAWELTRQLRSRRFDVVLDPQSLTKSSLLSWISGAPLRVGFAPPRGRELSRWLNNRRVVARRPHVVDHQLDLLETLGIDDRRVDFSFPQDPDAAGRMETFLAKNVTSGRFATLNPGAGWESRTWPPERFGQVAAYLAERHHMPTVVVWAGERERVWAEEIVEASGRRAVLAPSTSLPELAALLRKTCLLVDSDTGPTHLAAAVGTRCVTLFSVTRPEVSGPYGLQHEFVTASGAVADSRHHRWASNEGMRLIEVSTVCEACDRSLVALSRAA